MSGNKKRKLEEEAAAAASDGEVHSIDGVEVHVVTFRVVRHGVLEYELRGTLKVRRSFQFAILEIFLYLSMEGEETLE